MNSRVLWLGAISLLTLSACINSSNTRVSSMKEIDKWLHNEHYEKALSLTIERQKKYPSELLDAKIIEIKKQAAEFDKQQSQSINELISTGKLNLANQQLEHALNLYPHAPGLLAIQKHLHGTQSDEISRLQAQQLLSKAEWLLESRKVQQSLESIKPDSTDTFKDPKDDFIDTALELYHIGIKAMQNHDYKLADSCLTMSNKLYPRPLTESALARLSSRQQLQLEKQKQRQATLQHQQQSDRKKIQRNQNQIKSVALIQTLKQQQQDFDSLYLRTQQLIKEKELVTAKNNIQQLKLLSPKHKDIAVLETAYLRQLPEYVNDLTTRANQFYIDGKIQQAKKLWQQALKADPENEKIKESLLHADRVQQRLDELKQQTHQ